MENKSFDVTFKINPVMLCLSLGIMFLISIVVFCACYNIPIVKAIREAVKSELIKNINNKSKA